MMLTMDSVVYNTNKSLFHLELLGNYKKSVKPSSKYYFCLCQKELLCALRKLIKSTLSLLSNGFLIFIRFIYFIRLFVLFVFFHYILLFFGMGFSFNFFLFFYTSLMWNGLITKLFWIFPLKLLVLMNYCRWRLAEARTSGTSTNISRTPIQNCLKYFLFHSYKDRKGKKLFIFLYQLEWF